MNLIIDWLKSLESKNKAEVHIKINKETEKESFDEDHFKNENFKKETFENEAKYKEVDDLTLTEKYWLTILFVFLRYFSILMYGSGIGFIIAGILVSPWWYLGLASWPLFIMIGVVNMVYICALTKHHRLQFRHIVNNY